MEEGKRWRLKEQAIITVTLEVDVKDTLPRTLALHGLKTSTKRPYSSISMITVTNSVVIHKRHMQLMPSLLQTT